jgi:dTDP-4-dehydrorhamnose 3,5-epimerase-like enzyme
MIRLPTELPGLILLAPEVHRDDRGSLVETFRLDQAAALGINQAFVQENQARSALNTPPRTALSAHPWPGETCPRRKWQHRGRGR